MRGSLRQRGEGTWQIRLTDHDPASGQRKWRSVTLRGTKKQAEAELTRLLRDMDTGTFTVPTKVTVREFLDKWLADHVAVDVPKKSTRDGYARKVRNHILPALGGILLSKLTPVKVQEFYRAKLDSGLSTTSVNDIHRVLHRALEIAVKWGLVGKNVCDATEPPKKRRVEMQIWTPEECQRFLAVARQNRYHALLATAIYTGLRQGELLGLRWRDLDLDAGVFVVQQTLEKAGTAPIFGTPKTPQSRRTVPLSPELVLLLRQWKAKQNEERLSAGPLYRDYGLIFTIPGGAPISRHNFGRRDFARLIQVANVPTIRFHDLRHSFASLLLGANVDLKIVSEMLGHSNIGITADTYGHLRLGVKRQAASVVGQLLTVGTAG
jgi:integrase